MELAVFAAIALAAVALIVAIRRQEKRRVEETRQAANMMGFSFAESPGIPAPLAALPLGSRGSGRKARFLLEGETAGRPVLLVEYEYSLPGGKGDTRVGQTVALFPGSGATLPDFELAPENILHRIGAVFGYQDMDFQESPQFSRSYLLRGEDEAAVRQAFNRTVLAFLGENPGWSVESRGPSLGIFRAGKVAKPAEYPVFLANALRIASALKPGG